MAMKNVFDGKLARTIMRVIVVAWALICLCYICPPAHDYDPHAITGTAVASDTALSLAVSTGSLTLGLTPTSDSGIFASTVDGDVHATIHVVTTTSLATH